MAVSDLHTPATRPDSRVARRAWTWRAWAAAWLFVTLWLSISLDANGPAAGMDPAWQLFLNTYGDLDFGPDLIWTYGPWGFLDTPLIIGRLDFALGLGFELASTVSLWAVLRHALARGLHRGVAAPLATVATIAATQQQEPSSHLVAASAGIVLLMAVPPPSRDATSQAVTGRGLVIIAVLAAVGALVLQVKLSDGVAVVALTGLATLVGTTLRDVGARIGVAAGTFLITSTALWLLRDQEIFSVLPWLRGSVEIVRGYGLVMAVEDPTAARTYRLAAVVVVLLGVATWRVVRRIGLRNGAVAVSTVVLVTAFAAKDGFSRHDVAHTPAFFLITSAVLVVLAGLAGRDPFGAGAAWTAWLLAVWTGFSALAVWSDPTASLNPVAATGRWRSDVAVLVSPNSHDYRLQQSRTAVRNIHAIPASMLERLGHDTPVHIDPFETSAAWIAGLRWKPVPVPQSYSAYTEYLDRLNAEAIADASPHQAILRHLTAYGVDGHNLLWEAPRYQLAVACNYAMEAEEASWQLLRHVPARCGEASELETHDVEAGEPVAVPRAPEGSIVLATFSPDEPALIDRIGRTIGKAVDHLYVTADGTPYRAAQAPSTGPMIVTFPDVEAGAFAPVAYQELAFNKPGQLTFTTVPIQQ
jgi:hypothetical protein